MRENTEEYRPNLEWSFFDWWYVYEQLLPIHFATVGTFVLMHWPGYANQISPLPGLELASSYYKFFPSVHDLKFPLWWLILQASTFRGLDSLRQESVLSPYTHPMAQILSSRNFVPQLTGWPQGWCIWSNSRRTDRSSNMSNHTVYNSYPNH